MHWCMWSSVDDFDDNSLVFLPCTFERIIRVLYFTKSNCKIHTKKMVGKKFSLGLALPIFLSVSPNFSLYTDIVKRALIIWIVRVGWSLIVGNPLKLADYLFVALMLFDML